MGHGFKVFVLQATKNGRGKGRIWDDTVWKALVEIVEALATKGPIEGMPILRESRAALESIESEEEVALEEKNPPVFLLLEPLQISKLHLHFVVSSGQKGRHPDLVKDGGRQSIADASANAHYRVDIWRAEDSDTALVAMETINGYCPQVLLRGHLQATSRGAVMVDDPKNPDRQKRQGDYVGFKMIGQPDSEYLRKLVKEAEKASAVFRDTTVSARGQQKVVNAELSFNLKTKERVDAAVNTVSDWVDALLAEAAVDGAVEAMKAEFGVDESGLEALGLEVDDVSLVLKPKNGTSRIYSPNLVRQLFDYPVTSYKPSHETYYGTVVPKVHNLAMKYDCNFEVESAREVAECLTGSI